MTHVYLNILYVKKYICLHIWITHLFEASLSFLHSAQVVLQLPHSQKLHGSCRMRITVVESVGGKRRHGWIILSTGKTNTVGEMLQCMIK